MKSQARSSALAVLLFSVFGLQSQAALLCPQAHAEHRYPVLEQLKAFANGETPDLRDPNQAALFHIYRLRHMGDPTTQLKTDTTTLIAGLLKSHPELAWKTRFSSVTVDLVAPMTLPENVARTIQQTKTNSSMIFGKLIHVSANSGFWNKVFENVPAPSAESQGFLGALVHSVTEKGKQVLGTRWKKFMPEDFLAKISADDLSAQQKTVKLFQHLQSIRQSAIAKAGAESPTIRALSQAMADLVGSMPFSQKDMVEMLKSDDGAISIQIFDSLLAQRESLAQELGYTNYSDLLISLNIKQPSALSLPNDKFMMAWNEMKTKALEQRSKLESGNTFTARQLSAAEAVFRSCLGGNECSSRTYPEKALDPNYQYFTATDADFHSDSHVTVVLGTGLVDGLLQKVAFIDKVQNMPAERLAAMLEGVRQSLAEQGYILAGPKHSGDDHTGLSNSPSTRSFFMRIFGLEGSKVVEKYDPHSHSYALSGRFSRASNKDLEIHVVAPLTTEGVAVKLQPTPEFRKASPFDLHQMARDSYALKNGDDRDKVVYVKIQDILNPLGMRDPQYPTIASAWLDSKTTSFAVKKQILLTAEPEQVLELAEAKLSESERPRFYTAVVSSPFYRQAIGVEKIYQFLESNPEYMKQVSSQRLAGFSLQKILKLELDQLFMTAVEAPGAKINEGSRKTGQTPAHMAAKLGNIANMQKLLEKGASLATVNFKDRTPLIQSLMSDQTEMSLFILQQPQDLNLNQIDVEGHTALYYAITHGQTAAIEPLFRKGADFQFHDMYGIIQNNALHEAVNSENPEILKAVLATQVLAIDEADVKGLTPLMKAAMNNQEELVRILLAAGASKTLASPNGKTATDFARKRGYQSIVDLLQ